MKIIIVKTSSFIVLGYDTMHLVMGYNGNKEKKIFEAGFDRADAIINRYALMYRQEEVCA